MLNETETEETIVFFVTFLSIVAFQLGEGAGPCPLPPGYAHDLNSLTAASKKTSSKLTLPVNFYYLFTKSDLKVETNIVLERGICVITIYGQVNAKR